MCRHELGRHRWPRLHQGRVLRLREGHQHPQWPQFVTLHNTDAPDLKTYAGYQTRKPPVTDQQWLKNLEHNYRDLQHWSSGPHLFIVPKERGILAFTPLTMRGTHSPSWNGIAWAIEMVGNYTRDPFDSGDGAIVRDNAVHALAVLHMARGLDPKTIKFHREDKRTTHRTCPGKNVIKSDIIIRVEAAIADMHHGEHTAPK